MSAPIVMQGGQRPQVRWSQRLDSWRRYLTDDPTPSQFSALLKQVDDGDLAAMVELNEEMEGKDAHLQNVAARRREALTALDWTITPDTSAVDQAKAKKAAEFCDQQLLALKSFPETLEHLADAIGPGIAVTELMWHRGRIADTNDVPGHRLLGDIFDQRPGVWIETEDEPVTGIKARPLKYIVHTPNSRAGFPLRVTPTRANAYLWLIKHYCISDWTSFTETYGQPVRVATYEGDLSA
jgi:phage gp29-like protein